MNNDLEDLKQAMRAATPDPDPSSKAAHLALAQKNFVSFQGSRNDRRPISNRPKRGIWMGAFAMLNSLTSRAALTATTAVVAAGFVVVNWLEVAPPKSDLGGLPVPEGIAPAEAGFSNRIAPSQLEQGAESAEIDDTAVTERLRSSVGSKAEGRVSGFFGAAPADAPHASIAAPPTLSQRVAEPAVLPHDVDREVFANEDPGGLQVTSETPVSTFSMDVDTASYAIVRNSLMNGHLPNPDAVRVEEMINYFPYDYPAPDGAAFQPTVSVGPTPWNPDTRLVHIGIQGALPDIEDRAPLNLVFLIDTSGSMNEPNKLPLLKQSFRLMLGQLRPSDQVSIVTYAGSAGQILAPTNALDRAAILAALDQLDAGGSTAGHAGLRQAYATAAAMAKEGEVSRVILATDGDFNVGISDPDALKKYVADKRDSGTYLSVLGFGRGNLNDATMQALAQNGNGQAAYIDTLAEAQKVLVDQLTGALFPIANDVKIQVEFNPSQIAEYRLIGYETRVLRREDFNNDAVDAGDIGAGHSVTALYEVTPVGSPAQLTTSLRYGAVASGDGGEEWGFLALRYKPPGTATSQLIETPITADLAPLPDAGFATAIAGFGQLLRGSTYVTEWSFEDAIALAVETKGDDPFGYRAEAVQLMRLAASLTED
ncbi:VWA domain-containing protein [Ruegeria sp. HKCCD8929]|uniref:vWA domain-containing protein n=1 Tax=Ruegeria sp. HKCCD8929 TaxID=2683006 RepID=UPI0014877BB3|nr:VWA domain-containing protein [Ruegeria sp. HKCCD8929]